MKKFKLCIFLFLLFQYTSSCYSQEAISQENDKPIFGIQTGFLGVWLHNELPLSSELYLRSEVGFDFGFGGGGSYNEFRNNLGLTEGFAIVGSISLEPRFYYNLEKRGRNGKNILANSANFIALKTKYYPGLLIAAQNKEKVAYTSQISFTPYWALKRTIYKHFTYEAGAGLGYLHNFKEKGRNFNEFDKNALYLHLHLRIGYTF